MTTALVVDGSPPAAVDLDGDLAAAGIRVVGRAARGALVREVALTSPDVVVCHDVSPDERLFAGFALLAATAPRPVVLFANDPDAAKIERAMSAGIHAYVVNGYGADRLRGVIRVAQARFAHEATVRTELADVTRRFDERKLVDRAKGILMRARQVSEEEAFSVLRAASMHSNRRVGQVSQQVIAAAHYADAVNRAGKLRMLSQRLVKACALRLLDRAGTEPVAQIDDAVAQIEANLAALAKSLSIPTFGDLLDAAAASWAEVRALAAPAISAGRLQQLDVAAERLLQRADQLTRQLETAGLVTTLHVINVSGRQRMLTQRHAKHALLGLVLAGDAAAGARAALAETAVTFEDALAHLRAIPLSTVEIRSLLDEAGREWDHVGRAALRIEGAAAARALDASSETLLGLFEQLTDRYERSMQVLMG